jgi:hypothetical protein
MNNSDKINNNAADTALVGIDLALASIGFPPITTLFYSIGKTISSLRHEILIDNLKAFFSNAKKADKQDIDRFFQSMANDKDAFIKKLIVCIERVNDEKKSEMLGNLFVNLVKDKLATQEFLKLCFIIEKVFLDDLVILKTDYSSQEIMLARALVYVPVKNPLAEQSLFANALLINIEQSRGSINPIKYEISELGKIFNQYAFIED